MTKTKKAFEELKNEALPISQLDIMTFKIRSKVALADYFSRRELGDILVEALKELLLDIDQERELDIDQCATICGVLLSYRLRQH
jgi:hypothetical protein